MMKNIFDLTGQVAMITGGSRGLGKEMAMTLARAGADLIIASRNEKEIQAAAGEISAATGRRVVPFVLDVTDPKNVDAMVAQCMKDFGRIDIQINNAGVNVRAPIEKVRDEDWHMVQSVNVSGVMYCCRAAVPHMVKAGYGRIINVGSALGLLGMQDRISYCTSKGAVLQLTRALAVELAKTGVTVNCLCPGPFVTEINRPVLDNPLKSAELMSQIPMARWAEMEEIHGPILFLASRSSSYVTGAAISVDGGWAAK